MPAKFGWLTRGGSSAVVCYRLIDWMVQFIYGALQEQ